MSDDFEKIFNKLSNNIATLENRLLSLGEDKHYLEELKWGYIECYPGNDQTYELMFHYYVHLMNMEEVKYGIGKTT